MEDCELFNVCSTEIGSVAVSAFRVLYVCTWRLVTKVVLNVSGRRLL